MKALSFVTYLYEFKLRLLFNFVISSNKEQRNIIAEKKIEIVIESGSVEINN